MKPVPVLLGLSLVGNLALAGALVFSANRESAPSRPPAFAAADPSGATAPARVDTAALADALGTSNAAATDGVARFVALFNSGNPEQLMTALRAAGLSEDLVRTIMREQITARYRAQIRAIQEAANPPDRPYWQNTGRQTLTAEQRSEIRDLQRAMRDEIESVLGPDPNSGSRGGRFAYLPADKADLLAAIDNDYNELLREARENMQGFRLPSDRDAQELLQEERRRDIESLLSPEELAQFDQRNSPSAQRVRREYGALLQSEDEYLAIYRLQQAFDAQFSGENGNGEFNRRERGQAEELLRAQILDRLGPERTAQYAQQRDPDYQTMQAATARLNLPAEATSQVMDLRANAATTSQRIAADNSLDAAQKQAALASLAAQVRAELQKTMGQEGGDAFAQRADWLRALDRGASFSERAEGGVTISNGGRGGQRGGGAGPRGGANFDFVGPGGGRRD